MKAFASLFMSLVISAAMLTGCGCTNRNGAVTRQPQLPTIEGNHRGDHSSHADDHCANPDR